MQLVVVAAEGRRLLLGVSEKSVQLVTDLEADDTEDGDESEEAAAPARAAVPAAVPDFAHWLVKRIHARGRRS